MDLDDEQAIEEGSIDDEALGTERLGPEPMSDEDRLLVIFAYLGPLSLVALMASKRDFVRWHAKQGLLLGVAVLATFVVLRPFHRLLYLILPFLGQIFMVFEILIGLGFFLVGALCLVRAVEGRVFRIPYLADVADRF